MYKDKYLKYKTKYLNLKSELEGSKQVGNQNGGGCDAVKIETAINGIKSVLTGVDGFLQTIRDNSKNTQPSVLGRQGTVPLPAIQRPDESIYTAPNNIPDIQDIVFYKFTPSSMENSSIVHDLLSTIKKNTINKFKKFYCIKQMDGLQPVYYINVEPDELKPYGDFHTEYVTTGRGEGRDEPHKYKYINNAFVVLK